METIVLIRNTCAHSGVLFDFKTPKGIAAIPAITFENRDRHSLASCIKVISYMLEQISDNRKNDMIKAIEDTLYKYKENQVINNGCYRKIRYYTKSYSYYRNEYSCENLAFMSL